MLGELGDLILHPPLATCLSNITWFFSKLWSYSNWHCGSCWQPLGLASPWKPNCPVNPVCRVDILYNSPAWPALAGFTLSSWPRAQAILCSKRYIILRLLSASWFSWLESGHVSHIIIMSWWRRIRRREKLFLALTVFSYTYRANTGKNSCGVNISFDFYAITFIELCTLSILLWSTSILNFNFML